MLACIEAATGTSGKTTVQHGIVVTSSSMVGKPWFIRNPTVVKDKMFVRLCASDRRFLAFVGYNKNCCPLESNPFLQQLRSQRNDAVVQAMKVKQQTTGDSENKVVLKKDFIDEIDPVIYVNIAGFIDEDGEVAGRVVPMLPTGLGQESVCVQVDKGVLDFIRRGLLSARQLGAKRRKCKDETGFQQFPSAFLHKRGFIYCRCRNADGKWTRKSFNVPKGLDEIATRQLQIDAAENAQSFYNANHVEVADGDVSEEDEQELDEDGDEVGDHALPDIRNLKKYYIGEYEGKKLTL